MALTESPAEFAPPPGGPPRSGVRSGALLAVASAVSIVAAYAFLLASGRILGSDDYGSLAALLGLLAIILIPLGALQMAVSREVSRRLASADSTGAASLARGVLRAAAIATVPLVVVGLALAEPLSRLLKIDSLVPVVFTVVTLSTALVFPVAMGVLQGQQRFPAIAGLYVLPWVVRLVLLGLLTAAGARLGGAMFATLAGAVVVTGAAYALIRQPIRGAARLPRSELVTFLRYLAPVAIGLVGIALLTHVDILVVKARFSGDEAGAYGAASAFARVGFFLPATILSVLFPRTAARQARGEETEDILGRSLWATAGFCGALALFYAATGPGLVAMTFGPGFSAAGVVVAPLALAIGLFSLANVLVGYHLSRGEVRYAWIVGAGVVAQIVALATIPSSLEAVAWTNVVVGVVLLAAHELFVESSVPALRAGARHARGATARVRAVLPEAALATLGTVVFVCVLFWPVVVHMGSTILGNLGSDATATVAGFWEQRHEGGYHVLGLTHHTYSGAPFGWDQTNAYNTQVFLAYYPTFLIAHLIGDIAAYNLTTLAGFALSGLAMYLLARMLGCNPLVAAWAALVLIVFPFHFAHAEHASLLHVEVLALLFVALLAAAQRPTWFRIGLVGLANLACWLMSGYFGPMAAVSTIAFAIGVVVVARRRGLRLLIGAAIAAILAAGILGTVAVASNTNAGAGLNRAVGDLKVFGIRPADLFVPPPGNIVLGDRLDSFWSAHQHGATRAEVINYLGWVTILLAAVWLVYCRRRWPEIDERRRLATAGLVAAFVAGLLFALPSPLFGIPMPARLLYAFVPAFRVLSRWDFLLITALAPLAALGLQLIWRALARRSVAVASGAVALAMVVSFLELSLHPAKPRFRSTPAPAEFVAVKKTAPGILAEYPLGYSDVFRLWQRVHGRRLVNGAPPGSAADTARLMLLDPAQPGTGEALSLLGVTAVGLNPGAHVDAEVQPGNLAGDKRYKLVGRFTDGASVWDVVARPAPAFLTLAGGFGLPRREQDGSVDAPFVGGGGVGAISIAARSPGVVKLVFQASPPAGGQRVLRLDDGSGHQQQFSLAGPSTVSVLVQVPRGQSQLLVKTDPAPTSEADAIFVSLPHAEAATGTAALQAQLTSPDPGF
jgi:O-antigen/teichoic acid export membrane protein